MSTNPGATIFPVASIVSAASPSSGALPGPRRRTSTILPSLTATSASNRSAPVPSTKVPPVILRSNTITPCVSLPAATVANVTLLQTDRVHSGKGGSAPMTTQEAPRAGNTVGDPGRARREDAIGTPPKRPTLVPAERYYSTAFAQLEV